MQPKRSGRIADAIEIVASWRELGNAVEGVVSAAKRYANQVFHHYSHFYPQGASAYVIFQIERDSSARAVEDYHAIWTGALEAVVEAGGVISHHHGIGQVRGDWLERQTPGTNAVIGAIKTALDPRNILNQGALGLSPIK
jgi:alkyldihydroxyacetonephosphate synthase